MAHLWLGRVVKILDGSNVVMADTPANQVAYPQHSNQKAGCGFPIAKLLVVFSLATAAAVAIRIADFNTSEITLARQWYQTLAPGDIVLADRAYGSYVDLALVAHHKADGDLPQKKWTYPMSRNAG
ncbi:transposase [Leptothoe kymatousa]|uniref:Transposase n=1 Tax=Leptothoe kymatousa TAU-MAC 1615 TaxID=2364775 RepID=A0ABS5Y8I0_9CYAN|nr:transposase [Leptothoe kymatousa]MBT9313679.1 transposase [Leptothoe kymatousa TAU-MAC 1615]